mmetsp:Transcript_18565/g.39848  ORF Transcript_18565/g.39848 Transcript_18565/m.39848 type:complete len:120 (+) Transcript_18565:222-581(+)|eukprot:CAMPEP_0202892154 /NCGR_PEP_ID=MMETSP1392-20130828/1956_1 /ASSEMBLY_ACC=CAM_ASM_000868 /TAXON_ID=225041 /ORGANISM="Chlamydomonas chlamydogama, Strain SAG 11-48b" /LENGTH=119 /DNA_ID=CAMNT_0049576037 /DNA_START=198 /DNA_END=557 /DNA_ORIENTATION=+
MATQGTFELYRQTLMGDCLCETLEEMVHSGKITEELAHGVLKQFDASMLEALRDHVTAKALIKANLKTYRYYDNVWQFTLENVSMKLNQTGTGSMNNAPEVCCDRAKVVCVDSKLLEQS